MTKSIRFLLLSSLILVLAAPAAARVLTGELVVLDDHPHRFRLVGHHATFTAPAGTPLAELDGKPVEVELGSDGRVARIAPRPIAIQPITHGIETVTGQMRIEDAVTRTFTLAGDSRVYIAPMAMDIRPFSGRRVEVRLDSQGQVSDVRLLAAAAGTTAPTCLYEGRPYSHGGLACQMGTQHRCEEGIWRSLGQGC